MACFSISDNVKASVAQQAEVFGGSPTRKKRASGEKAWWRSSSGLQRKAGSFASFADDDGTAGTPGTYDRLARRRPTNKIKVTASRTMSLISPPSPPPSRPSKESNERKLMKRQNQAAGEICESFSLREESLETRKQAATELQQLLDEERKRLDEQTEMVAAAGKRLDEIRSRRLATEKGFQEERTKNNWANLKSFIVSKKTSESQAAQGAETADALAITLANSQSE